MYNASKNLLKRFLCLNLFVCILSRAEAQNLDHNSVTTVALTDGTLVTLYAQLQGSLAAATRTTNYYYLPTQVLLAKDPQTQIPKFLFLKYISDEREDQGGVSGALMHFLMQTGFTPAQLTEIQAKLTAKIPGATVKGPVDLFAPAETNSFTITSAVVNREGGMTKSLVTSGKAPLQQGGNIAVAANLNKFGAQLMAATFEKAGSITDLSVNLFYKYFVKVNGVKGKITVDYEKIAMHAEKHKVDATYDEISIKGAQDYQNQTWTELHNVYDELIENGAITIEIEKGLPDATSDKLVEMFFQLFLDKFANPATEEPKAPVPDKAEQEALPGRKNAYYYHLDRTTIKRSVTKKKETITLNYDFMMPMELSITQNLKTFYNAAKDNKECIASVILNDEWYKHMDIRFVLDLEAKEMFDQEINYVSVQARRKGGTGYVDLGSDVITKDYISKNGITKQFTYAGGTENRDVYQYKTQWSLKSGNMYPVNPQWEQGQMQAVTLKPPVVPRLMEFEADLDKLKSTDISRITLQVRYKKFDQEIEENINISPVQGQALVNKILFMDRDTRGYVYRLIFNHKTEGKLVMPWSVKLNDYYVYAVVPNELSDKTSELFIKAVDLAKTVVAPGPDGKVTTDKVLDQFREILGPKTN